MYDPQRRHTLKTRLTPIVACLFLLSTLTGCLSSMLTARFQANVAAMAPVKAPPASTDPKDLALFDALTKGDVAAVKAALAAGGSVVARDKTGYAALGYAATLGNIEAIQVLLDAHAELELPQGPGGFTPLMSAAGAGQVEAMKLLLAKGANLRAAPPPGWGPLAAAALMSGKVAAVKVLLDAGADANAKDALELTPLLWAASGAKTPAKIVEGLARGKAAGLSGAYFEQKEADFQGPAQIFAALVAGGANAKATNNLGRNALMIAASSNVNPEAVNYFLAQGLDVNGRDKTEETPLTLAAASGHLEVVKALIVAHADVNAERNGNNHTTPLIAAASKGHLEVVQALVSAGAEVEKELRWENLFGGKLAPGAAKTMPPMTSVNAMREYKPGTKAINVANATSQAEIAGKADVVSFLKSKGGTVISCSLAENLEFWCIDKDTKLDHF